MRNDPEVRGALYTGSLGDGTADRFSDLDIELWVTDAAYARARAKLRETLERLGVVQFLYSRGAATATGFVGPAWQRVDLALLTRDAIQPRAAYARARILTDTDDVLARAAALVPREAVATSWDQARRAPGPHSDDHGHHDDGYQAGHHDDGHHGHHGHHDDDHHDHDNGGHHDDHRY
jgi:hypothetical protein